MLLNTLPSEVMERALTQLNDVIQDYIDKDLQNRVFVPSNVSNYSDVPKININKVFSVHKSSKSAILRKFEQLTSKWKEETAIFSSIKKKINHPAYQEIIAMGEEVIPLILEELKREPSHWFYALSVITKADPVSSEDSFEQAVEAWLNWGKNQGYIK